MTGAPDVLANPVWHSLRGPRASLGIVRSEAARFDPDVAPFGALPDSVTDSAWAEMAALLGTASTALMRASAVVPDSWEVLFAVPCLQMVARGPDAERPVDLVGLGASDVDEMMALVAATQPGPFRVRTIECGGYIGVRDSGTLVAMAGERLRCPGYTEISAVCTAASHQGRGLAAALVQTLVHRIRSRGDEAVLHVATTNERAIRLYGALGFEVVRTMDVIGVRPA